MGRTLSSSVLGCLAALSSLLPPAGARAGDCTAGDPVLFAYPSLDAPRVPSNAEPFVIPSGYGQIEGFILDRHQYFSIAPGTKSPGVRFQPGLLLTPGRHELLVEFRFDEQLRVPVAWERQELELVFEVDPEPQPTPDETSAAQIVRVRQLMQRGEPGTFLRLGYEQERRRLDQPHAECSRSVAEQLPFVCAYSGRQPAEPRRDYFVELDAQGESLGYFVNGLFLPGHCRGAFFPEAAGGWSIQTVTATGLGTPTDFGGAVETVFAEPAPLPPAPPGPARESWWDSASSCSAARRGSSSNAASSVAVSSLLAVAVLARRKRRCAPASEPQPVPSRSVAQRRLARGARATTGGPCAASLPGPESTSSRRRAKRP